MKMLMKLSKKYLIIILLCLFAFTISACSSPMKIKAKHDAKEYIQEKYGINPTVKKVRDCTVDGLFAINTTGEYLADITEVGKRISVAMHERENRTYFCLYVGLFSFDNVDSFEKNLDKISGNEVFPFSHELRDKFIDMTDAQYISYKAKKDKDKLSIATMEETKDVIVE